MHVSLKRKLAIGAITLAAAAFAGGAYAATQDSGANARQAFLNDVARRLKVTPQQLRSAVRGAFLDQLQDAVAAGKLTQAQANAIKQHAEQNRIAPLGLGGLCRLGGLGPLGGPGRFGGPGFFGRSGGGPLAAAATYLGISRAQLFDQLSSGKSLAQVASSRGKSVAGLKAALLAEVRSRVDKAVAAKLITPAQEQRILSRVSSALDQEINRGGGAHAFGLRRFVPRPWSGSAAPYHGSPGSLPGPPGPPGAIPSPPGGSGPAY